MCLLNVKRDGDKKYSVVVSILVLVDVPLEYYVINALNKIIGVSILVLVDVPLE